MSVGQKTPRVRAGKIRSADGTILDALSLARKRAAPEGLEAEYEAAREWYQALLEKGRRQKHRVKRASRPAAWTAKLDKRAGDLVRARGVCEAAGTKWHRKCSGPLQWCHGVSRRHFSLRWDLLNAWSMCAAAHSYFTYHPFEWHEFMQRWPERWARIVAMKDWEPPKGAARIDWYREVEADLRARGNG